MYDVIVIGGGPSGVTAALRARELGASVALVERDRLGGTCTNDGCVPTRVLAKAARLLRNAEQYPDYGLVGEKPKVDLSALINRTQKIVYRIHEKKQLINHLEESGVKVYLGKQARFLDAHTIQLGDQAQIQAEKFILCAGGHARRIEFPGSEYAITHSDVWSLKTLPKSVVIVGAAATGCQLASIFAAFGAEIAMLEMAPRILPNEDVHISRAIHEAFEQRGICIYTGLQGVKRIEKLESQLRVFFTKGGQEFFQDGEQVILSVGWPGNVESLNLEAAGVQITARHYVQVDDDLRTTAENIFAAGDITGRMMLVQSAGIEARQAVENAVLNGRQPQKHAIVPHGGFTDPEYGGVGLTEEQALEQGLDYVVAVVPFMDMDRAVIDGHTEGFCKLVVSQENHRILGAHVVGEQAVEIVQFVAAGMAAEIWVEQIAELEIAYPTYTAIVGVAARRLVHELGVMPISPQWRSLGKKNVAEWERSDHYFNTTYKIGG